MLNDILPPPELAAATLGRIRAVAASLVEIARIHWNTPKFIAPSMNADMLSNPMTQRNLETIAEVGKYELLMGSEGWQACRTDGYVLTLRL